MDTFDSSVDLPTESTSETVREAEDDPTPMRPVETAPDAPETERYQVLDLLGEGGMGSVLRVRDTQLNRTVAMKVLKPKLLTSERALMRFKEEAQIAAQLQHPGIIPVHDIGRRSDGSVFFTMKEVKGETYEDVIDAVQVALENGKQRSASGWGFRRLIDAFHRVCETVAYAHHRGVAHRDLKPENVMVGAFGEVLVLDWGLAKILAEEWDQDEEGIITSRSISDSVKTRMGAIAGTPSYMAPEQARGQIHKITPMSDVYGLGGVLYAILTGRTPYMARRVRDLLDMVAEGAPIVAPIEVETDWPVPAELSDIAMKALSFRQEDRYPEAGAMALEVAAWLDGARRREKALEIVATAEAQGARVPVLLDEAAQLDARAASMLDALDDAEPLEARHPAWELERQATEARDEAEQLELETLQGLRSALTHAPDLPEAHAGLADRFLTAHQEAEQSGDRRKAAQMELSLRAHDIRGVHARYLKGDGAVTLVTEPPGASVHLYEYVEQHKRLVPVFRKDLGPSPIVQERLAMGRWMLKITHPGHHDVTYPVTIEREQHWDGVPPEGGDPFPIELPKLGELAEDDCYVPAGWFWSGGEEIRHSVSLPKRWLWCDALVFKRHPVTVGELLEAYAALQQMRDSTSDLLVPVCFGQSMFEYNATGPELLDFRGESWQQDWPAMFITFAGKLRFVEWKRHSDPLGWRLPCELEWVKAARGVDRRRYSWGHFNEPRFAAVNLSRPPHVGDPPEDTSVYGLCGTVGGVSDCTTDQAPLGSPNIDNRRVLVTEAQHFELHVHRGGSIGESLKASDLHMRKQYHREARDSRSGFRLCRSWIPKKL